MMGIGQVEQAESVDDRSLQPPPDGKAKVIQSLNNFYPSATC